MDFISSDSNTLFNLKKEGTKVTVCVALKNSTHYNRYTYKGPRDLSDEQFKAFEESLIKNLDTSLVTLITWQIKTIYKELMIELMMTEFKKELI